MSDARTPSHYFQDRDAQVREALDRVKGRLDELTQRLQELKAQRAETKAHKALKAKEIESVEKQRYRKRSRRFAMDAMDQIANADHDGAVEAIDDGAVEAIATSVMSDDAVEVEATVADWDEIGGDCEGSWDTVAVEVLRTTATWISDTPTA